MDLILSDLRIQDCEICCDIGDLADQGAEGTLKFEYLADGQPIVKEKTVTLHYPPRTESIPPTPHTGKVHSVKAILTDGNKSTTSQKHLRFCSTP